MKHRFLCIFLCAFILFPITIKAQNDEGREDHTAVDIILEPQTYTPKFYKGRAEPSVESSARAVAVFRNLKENREDLFYTWKIENDVLFGETMEGADDVLFTIPSLSQFYIRLTVTNKEQEIIAQTERFIPTSNPEVIFYEENLLRGIHDKNIHDPFFLTDEETTIVGLPYFVDSEIFTQGSSVEWEVDGIQVARPNEIKPWAISLGKGTAVLGFPVTFTFKNIRAVGQSVASSFFVDIL